MRQTLVRPNDTVVIFDRLDPPAEATRLEFPDRESALAFLRGLRDDSVGMRRLRALLSYVASTPMVPRLTDQEVIERLSWELHLDRVRVAVEARAEVHVLGAPVAEEEDLLESILPGGPRFTFPRLDRSVWREI